VSLCLTTTAVALTVAAEAFTLAWTHSVEQTEWRERWRVEAAALVLAEARVRGSGAGMEPPEGSVLKGGWWVYRRDLALPVLRLAVSGATGRGWQLCTDADGCRDLEALLAHAGTAPESIEIRPGPCRAR
jgi:hypothetical protein